MTAACGECDARPGLREHCPACAGARDGAAFDLCEMFDEPCTGTVLGIELLAEVAFPLAWFPHEVLLDLCADVRCGVYEPPADEAGAWLLLMEAAPGDDALYVSMETYTAAERRTTEAVLV